MEGATGSPRSWVTLVSPVLGEESLVVAAVIVIDFAVDFCSVVVCF